MERYANIHALVEKWKPILGLSDWLIDIEISDEYFDGDKECEACITEEFKYKSANLQIWQPFHALSDEHQEASIVHELVHLVLSRLHPYLGEAAESSEEEVVQTLAMLFYTRQ